MRPKGQTDMNVEIGSFVDFEEIYHRKSENKSILIESANEKDESKQLKL